MKRKKKGDKGITFSIYSLKMFYKTMFSVILIALSAFLAIPIASALELYNQCDWKIRWDNTLKYSMGLRVGGQRDELISNINADDGDRNFDKGITSTRFDVLSEMDLVYRERFGLRVSAAAWYDFMYNRDNDNDSPATCNNFGRSHDQFQGGTRRLHGQKIELLDGFVFGSGAVNGHGWNLRLGQHTLMWGESLFFALNGISVGQGPLDLYKGLSVPNTKAKELFRPVPQVSGSFDLFPGFTLAGFYQFQFRPHLLSAAGSYFSFADFFDAGGEHLFAPPPAPPGFALFRKHDLSAKNDGEFGVSAKYNAVSASYGLYYIKYNERSPQVYAYPGRGFNPLIGKAGEYRLVYPENIDLVGVSYSTTVFDTAIGCDVSYRHNMDLASSPAFVLPGMRADNADNALFARGNTLHINLNAMYIFAATKVWDSATFMGEVAMARCLSVTQNHDALLPGRQGTAWGFRTVTTLSYFQVLPNWNLDVPIGFAYFPRGSAKTAVSFGQDKGGDWSIGAVMKYLTTWFFTLRYTDYYGSPKYQQLTDRDFVSFSIEHTF